MSTMTIALGEVAQAPAGLAGKLCRAVADGSATVRIADARYTEEARPASIRTRTSVQVVTVAKAIRRVEETRLGTQGYRAAYPQGISSRMVREVWGYAPKADISTAPELRAQYEAALFS